MSESNGLDSYTRYNCTYEYMIKVWYTSGKFGHKSSICANRLAILLEPDDHSVVETKMQGDEKILDLILQLKPGKTKHLQRCMIR